MNTPLSICFPGQGEHPPLDVGGKADSLMRLAANGFPVPEGVVLTTAFFKPWLACILKQPLWQRLQAASSEHWPVLCEQIQTFCSTFQLNDAQRCALNEGLERSADCDVFAVRSSSPEEDLSGSSFAGGYESCLGVPRGQLESAIKRCFASVFDVRVLHYKQAQGLPLWAPQIAVIVQRQLASDIAGVGFSLNPITNDYDEAVIAANWGLGSTVVDGSVTPDHYCVNKATRELLELSLGEKQSAAWLDKDSGTITRQGQHRESQTLDAAQLLEVVDLIIQVEALYGDPVDIEWAFKAGQLHVLQARPITRYVPLPADMQTRPGQRRVLYADAALSRGLTTNDPISPLGLDALKDLLFGILEQWIGAIPRNSDPKRSVMFFAGARMYVNYSGLLWLSSARRLARSAAPTDALMADILRTVDPDRYRSEKRPGWLKLRLVWLIPRALWRLRRFLWNLLHALLAPERAYAQYRARVQRFQDELHQAVYSNDRSLTDYQRYFGKRLCAQMFDVMMPALLVGLASPACLIRRKNHALREHAARMRLGVPGDVVVEMGIALFRLARMLEPCDLNDIERTGQRIEQRRMPAPFMHAWDAFIDRFGHRGPMEMDLCSARYGDDARLALRQLSMMNIEDTAYDPECGHQRQAAERERARQALLKAFGPIRGALLRRIDNWIRLFAGTRDAPKHLLVLYNHGLRRRALALGECFARSGRLRTAEDIFNLRFDDLLSAQENPALDLVALAEERSSFNRKLQRHVHVFPLVIDSRGRILRPEDKQDSPNRLTGMAVSNGVVSGPVKVLHSPHDKTVEKGISSSPTPRILAGRRCSSTRRPLCLRLAGYCSTGPWWRASMENPAWWVLARL